MWKDLRPTTRALDLLALGVLLIGNMTFLAAVIIACSYALESRETTLPQELQRA